MTGHIGRFRGRVALGLAALVLIAGAAAVIARVATDDSRDVTPTNTNCIVNPHVCGYPDETNTGVPAGTALTSSGSITVTTDGTTLQDLDVAGQIIIRANNVTIKNVLITTDEYYPIDYEGTGLVVQDSEIAGTSPSVTSCISFDHYTALRVNCHGSADGFKADNTVVIQDCYVHDLAITSDSHNDGVQSTGGDNVTLIHNTFKEGGTGANAVIQFGGTNTNWLVQDNLMDGGGWTINGDDGDFPTLKFFNNRFTRNATFGPVSAGNVTWSGNYYDDDLSPVNN